MAYVVGTYQSSNLSLYIDGVLNASKTGVANPLSNTNNFQIGKWTGGGQYFNGSIGTIGVYNRAISNAEVLQNYNAQKSRYGLQ